MTKTTREIQKCLQTIKLSTPESLLPKVQNQSRVKSKIAGLSKSEDLQSSWKDDLDVSFDVLPSSKSEVSECGDQDGDGFLMFEHVLGFPLVKEIAMTTILRSHQRQRFG